MGGVAEVPNSEPDAVVLVETADPNIGVEETFETPNSDVVAAVVVDGTEPPPNKPVDTVVAPPDNEAVVVDGVPNNPLDGRLLIEELKTAVLVVVVALSEGFDIPKSPDEVVAGAPNRPVEGADADPNIDELLAPHIFVDAPVASVLDADELKRNVELVFAGVANKQAFEVDVLGVELNNELVGFAWNKERLPVEVVEEPNKEGAEAVIVDEPNNRPPDDVVPPPNKEDVDVKPPKIPDGAVVVPDVDEPNNDVAVLEPKKHISWRKAMKPNWM
ncbi:unnamed protein product [Angiostrongylus costaricensis]|uniref:DUF4777 domain-containing protein n=1 Tax=Angiostrongylus costaricensis TaxID=334426 RepID=A0A0R3PJJ7_ANGCS|nr:unnamed protein product [Angiostrongylus costaricensis]